VRAFSVEIAVCRSPDDRTPISVVVNARVGSASGALRRHSFDCDLVNFVGDRVISVSSQAVDAGPDQELRSGLSSPAEKLVDVALAITDIDASPRITQKLGGLLNIL
jgi:hypothetical protein